MDTIPRIADHHPDAEALWLRIVAADPRYIDCLTVAVCATWLNQLRGSRLIVVDRDGDTYMLVTAFVRDAQEKYDAQVVVDQHGQVQPCTDTIAEYLRRRTAKWENEP